MKKSRRARSTVFEERCPLDSLHGHVRLEELLAINPRHLAAAGNDAALEAWRPEESVFFDLETTGLSGERGAMAFLAGTACVEKGDLVFRQFFMADPRDEAALLGEIHDHLRRFRGLVTYNGKSFDVPLLRARLAARGVADGFDAGYHLDLLCAARRLWRGGLPSCRLKAVEAGVLGISRTGDVDGWRIPGLYLEYLRLGSMKILEPVLFHNLMDVKSLAALTILAADHAGGKTWRQREFPEEAVGPGRAVGARRRRKAAVRPGAGGGDEVARVRKALVALRRGRPGRA